MNPSRSSFKKITLTSSSPIKLNIGIVCAYLPLLSPLGREIPSKDYIRNKYHSMVSLIRSGRSTSRNLKIESGNEDYLELMESGDSKPKALDNRV